jgi:methionyl aminopeptidase
MIRLKSKEDVARIRQAGRIVAQVLAAVQEKVRPGVETLELDRLAHSMILRAGAVPSFLGYGNPPYPASICTSIDDEVVHGIPGHRRLEEGSLISIDVGACLAGFHADAARTFAVGRISAPVAQLIEVTEQSFWKGFAAAIAGNRVGDVSAAVQTYAESFGYGVVRQLTGHGVGFQLHEDPDVPNFGRSGRGPRIEHGLVIAVEPMINAGGAEVEILDDGWTIVTRDGARSSHFEHTLAVLEDGPVVLTLE